MKPSEVAKDMRVRIRIARPETWHREAVAALDGRYAVVEAVKPTGHDRSGPPTILVRFEEPAPDWRWRGDARTLAGFHFGAEDLEPAS